MTDNYPARQDLYKNLLIIPALAFISLVGCSTTTTHRPLEQNTSTSSLINKNDGAYYLDDGPENNPPTNLDAVPDATPKVEPLRKANMRPYVALGNSYKPMTELSHYKKRGIATWYGRRYHGNQTASGEVYDMYAMTAAHPTLPLPSYARVTNVKNGKSVIVRINDRGPFLSNRLIDLSYTAAYKLRILQNGQGEVEVESILPGKNMSQQTKPAPNETRPQQVKNNVESNKVYLQLGAFGIAGNAYNFLSHIQTELPSLSQTVGITETNGLFRIKAGPYPNQMLAQQAADYIIQQLSITPMLIID